MTPINGIEVTADMPTTIVGTNGCEHIAEGETVTVRPGVALQCADTVRITGEKLCTSERRFVTIAPGEAAEMEVAGLQKLAIKSSASVAYFEGTEDVPLSLPDDLSDVKEGAPELLFPETTHVKAMAGVTAIALLNCGEAPAKVELVSTAC